MRKMFKKLRNAFDRYVEKSLFLHSTISVLLDKADLSDFLTLFDPILSAILNRFRKNNEYEE